MKTLITAAVAALLFTVAAAATPGSATVAVSDATVGAPATVSGCGYAAGSTVLVYVKRKSWHGLEDSESPTVVNFEPAVADSNGCFAYVFVPPYSGGHSVSTFTSGFVYLAGHNFRVT